MSYNLRKNLITKTSTSENICNEYNLKLLNRKKNKKKKKKAYQFLQIIHLKLK